MIHIWDATRPYMDAGWLDQAREVLVEELAFYSAANKVRCVRVCERGCACACVWCWWRS